MIYLNKKNILNFSPKEFKYLSPNFFKYKKNYYLLFANRGKISGKKYSSINLAMLIKGKFKKIVDFELKQKNKYGCNYLSPFFYKSQKNLFIYLESTYENQSSEIIRYKSRDFKNWELDRSFAIKKKDYDCKSPFIIKKKNKEIIYFTIKKKRSYSSSIICKMIKGKREKKILSSTNIIYSPSIILLKNNQYLFYSEWNKKENCKIKIIKLSKKKITKMQGFFENNINISEPCLKIFEKNIFIFYEFKTTDEISWNISFTSVRLKTMSKYLK